MSTQMSSQGTAAGEMVKGQEMLPARKGREIVPADQVHWDEEFDVVVVGVVVTLGPTRP